jgi:hypothetical protein
MTQANLREMTEGRPDDWVATCMVCYGDFAIRHEDSPNNPSPSGSFCPDCKAPGVLHWRQRTPQATTEPSNG